MKRHIKAPLPFQGQKRNFLKQTLDILRIWQLEGKINQETIFVDVFGGSGLLSHNIKCHFKKNLVIYNDFDDYSKRIHHIATTEKIRLELLEILGLKQMDRGEYNKLNQEEKKEVLEYIKTKEKTTYIDWITLYSWLSFGGAYYLNDKILRQKPMYHRVTSKPLNADGYLDGVEIINKDFREVFNDFESQKNTIYLLDPPYLQTQTENAYKERWSLKCFLDLVDLIKTPYLFYSSESSDVIEFFAYASRLSPALKDYELAKAKLNIGTSRNDFLLYKY